jgi:putative transposase
MAPTKKPVEDKFVTDMLAGGHFECSDSRWSAPMVLVTKKDGGTRFCDNYRQLNDVTVKDAYSLPRIEDTLDMLADRQWFSTLDLASGNWQISLSEEARRKTAFATHSGRFQFMQCPSDV